MGAPREVLRGAELRLWSLSSGLQEMQEQEIPPPPNPPSSLFANLPLEIAPPSRSLEEFKNKQVKIRLF